MNEHDYKEANAALDALLDAARTTAAEWQFEVDFMGQVETALVEIKKITVPLREHIAASIMPADQSPIENRAPALRSEQHAASFGRRFGGHL